MISDHAYQTRYHYVTPSRTSMPRYDYDLTTVKHARYDYDRATCYVPFITSYHYDTSHVASIIPIDDWLSPSTEAESQDKCS